MASAKEQGRHTPGPLWIVGEDECPEGIEVIELGIGEIPGDYKQVAYVQPGHDAGDQFTLTDEDRANAAHIVRAWNNHYALLEALEGLLARDVQNTCVHEDTHRGGSIWEICNDCDAMWADDKGGKPEWEDPPEWDRARTAISAARGKQEDS